MHSLGEQTPRRQSPHIQFIGHREVREALASRWVFLRKVDFPLAAKLGTPQAYAPLQGALHAAVALTRKVCHRC